MTTVSNTALIHPYAYVADSQVESGCKIWQFASILHGAMIGENTTVGATAIVHGAFVGRNCSIVGGAFIPPGVVIGNDCFIGPHAVFCNDCWPRRSKANFSGFIPAIAYGNEKERLKAATIVVEDGASIGANATVLPGVIIGRRAMVAAGARVSSNVPKETICHWDGRISPIFDELEDKRLETRCRNAHYIKSSLAP